jgi:hypothetical protein
MMAMIKSGDLLVEQSELRPRCFEVQANSHPNAWRFIQHNLTPQDLEKELSATGWTFFFMAGAIRKTTFGFDREKAASVALERAIKGVKELRCNCLQIESVQAHSFLGIPWVCVSAYARHVQKGTSFSGKSPDGPHTVNLRSAPKPTSGGLISSDPSV